MHHATVFPPKMLTEVFFRAPKQNLFQFQDSETDRAV